jgi:hypothetical protein
MKERRNPLILLFALVVVCALLYGLWHLHQGQVAEDQHHQSFTAPVPSGLPNFLNATPGTPPPQP